MSIFWTFLKWRLGLVRAETKKRLPYLPQSVPADLVRINNPDDSEVQLTWVGHSTFLVQVAGLNILTDPIWSTRASPVQWAGPKRQARPGIRFEDLPPIDVVLVSHTHYDHLDRSTILRLTGAPHYVVPERVAPWFVVEGIVNVTELSWWQSTRVGELKITAVPAKHWSKRWVYRTENTGWCGYVLETPVGVIYFVGDTGYHESYFKDIGKRFPAIDIALVPIGAYYPRSVFGRFHIDPREAVQLHKEVGARKSIGMHWGVFKLTQEPLQEPPLELSRQRAAAGVSASEFSVMKIGETRYEHR